MQKVYRVELSNEDRHLLKDLVKRGAQEKGKRPSALKLTRARILLKADQSEDGPAYADAAIAEALDVKHSMSRRKPFLTFERSGSSWV
jgi:hypothetical protein